MTDRSVRVRRQTVVGHHARRSERYAEDDSDRVIYEFDESPDTP